MGRSDPERTIHCHMVPVGGDLLLCDDPAGRVRRAVFSLAQDARGALWIGTEEGPIRFDGLGWGPTAGTAALGNSLTWTIDSAEAGTLWIGTKDAGLWRLGERGAAFAPLANLTGADGLADTEIIALGRDGSGALWVGTHDGLAILDGQRVRICFTARDGIPLAGICALAPDPGGVMLAGSLSGLLVFTPRAMRSRLSAEDGLPDPCVYALCTGSDGEVWAGTRHGIAVLRAGAVQRVIQDHLPAEVRVLCRDHAGRMWAGTARGVALIEEGTVRQVWSRADGLPSSSVWALLCDNAGRIWIGTEAGLAVFPGAATPAHTIHLPGDYEPGAFAFAADDRRMVIGADQGLLAAEIGVAPSALALPTPAALARAGVWAVAAIEGNLWAGGRYGGLYCLARTDGAVLAHLDGVGAIFCLCPDDGERLWVGTAGSGLVCVGRGDGRILLRRTTAEGLPNDHIAALLIDHEARLWAATLGGGIARIDRASGAVLSVLGTAQGLPGNIVSDLSLDQDGRLWAATRGGGLCVLNPDEERVLRVWTTAEGLPSNALYSCRCDHLHMVWVGTARGLARLNPRTGHCLTLGRPHGLPSDDCQQSALLLDAEGGVWVGTTEGIARVDPGAVPINVAPGRAYLAGVRVMGQPRLDLENLAIAEDEYEIEFEFGVIDFAAPAHVVYRTQLVGLEEGWSRPREQRLARYTNLHPREYTFRVQARNWGGEWGEAEELPFCVLPDRQAAALRTELERQRVETAVERATAHRLRDLNQSLLATQMMQSILMSELERQRKAAETLAQLRFDFVAGASHELRTPLTAILGYAELLAARWQSMDEAQRSATMQKITSSAHRQLRLVEDLLLASWIETARLPLDLTMPVLADLVERAAEEVRAVFPAQRIDLHGSPTLQVRGDGDRIVQILTNLIDNAAKYSAEGSPVTVRWLAQNEMCVVLVRDRGPGIPAEAQAQLFSRFGRIPGMRPRAGHTSTGMGLYLSHLLAEAMKGSLDLASSGPEGSTFRLELPLADTADGAAPDG